MTASTDPKTHIAMVLDRSGSMSSCKAATIEAVNSYFAKSRKEAEGAGFEMLIFDSEAIDTIRDCEMKDVADLTSEDFVPRASTPLYDAIGRAIDKLDVKLKADKSEKGVLVIVTDGMENASRKHTHSTISELITARQAAGWLVLFLGAGLDAAKQAITMGIRAESTANIGTDRVSLSATMSSVAARSAHYAMAPTFEAHSYAATQSFSADERQAMGDASAGAGLINQFKAPPPAARKKMTGDAYDTKPTDAWS